MRPLKMILAGPNESVLTRSAYPVFNRAGFRVEVVIDAPDQLRDAMAVTAADLAVIEANIVQGPDEALALLSDLGDVPIVAILPLTWKGHRERFIAGLPNLVAGYCAPVNWPSLAAKLIVKLGEQGRFEIEPSEEQEGPAPQPTAVRQAQPPVDRGGGSPSVRVGLYGCRGGAGVSTAALAAARALAREGPTGQRVALFDSRGRGDLHLMAGLQALDAENPVVCQGVTLFPCAPTPGTILGFDAVVVDGGRERGELNADWHALDKPLSDDQVRALVGLAPIEVGDEGSGRVAKKKLGKPKVRDWGGLISIEVTG